MKKRTTAQTRGAATLTVHEWGADAKTSEVLSAGGCRVVTSAGVYALAPLVCLDTLAARPTVLPAFEQLHVVKLRSEPDLRVEFPEEAKDQYELHLDYCKEHGQTPRTREQHKSCEQEELKRVFGLADGVQDYCLSEYEQVALALAFGDGGSSGKKPNYRAIFRAREGRWHWLLESFHLCAPTPGEAALVPSSATPKAERRLEWWHRNLEAAKGKAKDGKEFVVPLSDSLREVLRVLLETPGEPVPQKRLNERISKSRTTQDYRAAKIFRSAEAKQLFEHGVLQEHKLKGGKSVCFSIAVPADPPAS